MKPWKVSRKGKGVHKLKRTAKDKLKLLQALQSGRMGSISGIRFIHTQPPTSKDTQA